MNQTLINALREQHNRERMNAAVYRAMSDQLDLVFWPGSSAWMKSASNEEQAHADKFAAYMVDRNIQPEYREIMQPVIPMDDNLPLFFAQALELEKTNTESIKELYFTAESAEDLQTCTFLIWALDEQTAAERELTDIITMLRRLDKTGWMIFDKGLG